MEELIIKKALELAFKLAEEKIRSKFDKANDDRLKDKKEKYRDDLKIQGKTIDTSELQKIRLLPDERIGGEIEIDEDRTLANLIRNQSTVSEWSKSVSFKDLKGPKRVSEVYVELDAYVTPRGLHFDEVESSDKVLVESALLDTSGHKILLGGPGAGKTTSMKRISGMLLENSSSGDDRSAIPILLRFRDFRPRDSLIGLLSSFLGINIKGLDEQQAPKANNEITELLEEIRVEILDELDLLIVLDGFDEYQFASDKGQIINEFRHLCRLMKKSKLVLTCRTGEFNYSVDGANTFELSPLSQEQVIEFAENWLKSKADVESFVHSVSESPFADTAIRPLALAHLCAIYERIGKVPDTPKTIYRKLVTLLVEDWDQQRSITRNSNQPNFDTTQKFDFLCSLAYHLTIYVQKSSFTIEEILTGYRSCAPDFGLPPGDARAVIGEIEDHTGLFVQAGFETFEFAHKSIQEYLTAEHIVRLPNLDHISPLVLMSLGSELAIAVAISSKPGLYLSELTLAKLNALTFELPVSFFDAFVSRMVLEKPVLAPSKHVTLSLVSILSAWITKSEDLDKFDAFTALTGESINPDDIAPHYKIIEEAQSVGDSMTYAELERPLEEKRFSLPPRIIFPG